MKSVLLTSLLTCLVSFSYTTFAFEDTYKLGAGDKIQISVYGEENLSIEELYINNSGKFDYPYLGQLTVLNKTPEQLKSEITKGLKGDYLISPKVRVSVIGFRSIYVNGEVKKPGGYEYQPGLTVDKAIALAGGFTDRAARNKVYITQSGSDDQKNRVKLTSRVKPGDIIEIDQSFF
ncbi:polysaccharide biosynthesis/export family protein [Vibrio hepatarius]|jgi:polysaccharide export outer membrane protein|uniref:Capsular biosynthesis protein n=1 Tax=Vibrio hepatarius TaxID=171383 RepID=A0A0M0HZI2_9VIBR|nr:polysaccharide biosynthesis/export family protein [Vibrio hepatarius]KOO07484.1 capsular biosynthesis protein [Vibrio hepatarius]NOI14352.1 polysaccharide export protein [Vibrio hepatarius]